MEWEVMFMCNSLGVLILVAIALFHILGVPAEKNAEILDFTKKE